MNKWKGTTQKLSLWMFLESQGDSVAREVTLKKFPLQMQSLCCKTWNMENFLNEGRSLMFDLCSFQA